jgi:hypothetical protein
VFASILCHLLAPLNESWLCDVCYRYDDDDGVDNLSDEEYKDATVIMQLLRDNLNLWTAEGEDKGGDDDEDGQ